MILHFELFCMYFSFSYRCIMQNMYHSVCYIAICFSIFIFCRCLPLFLIPLVEEIFALVFCHRFYIYVYYIYTDIYIYSWAFYSIPMICEPVLGSNLIMFYYCFVIVWSQRMNFLNFPWICISYMGSFVVWYKFWNCLIFLRWY